MANMEEMLAKAKLAKMKGKKPAGKPIPKGKKPIPGKGGGKPVPGKPTPGKPIPGKKPGLAEFVAKMKASQGAPSEEEEAM